MTNVAKNLKKFNIREVKMARKLGCAIEKEKYLNYYSRVYVNCVNQNKKNIGHIRV